MVSNELENYLALLTIRRAAGRRDTVIMGGIFFLSVVSMVVFGLLYGLNGRSVYIVAALMIVFGFAYLTTWVKLEITKGSLELLKYLQHSR
jgi:4-hydroxybenzoate polyprenyltransferase